MMATHPILLSNRVKNLQESATLKINALVNRLKSEGKTIYNLTAGEPDFAAPQAAKDAVVEAVAKNLSRYTPTPGLPELRELVAKKTNAQQPALASDPWTPQSVVITNGGKQALFDVILALIDQEDEVIIPAPFWLSYPEMVKAAEGRSVIVHTTAEQHYKITPAQLQHAITARTKMFIINSPSNPTGAMYTRQELRALGDVLRAQPHIWIVSDEIYDLIEFETGAWSSFLEVNPELRDRTVTVNGLSKSGAMTGWRIGWSVTPNSLTPALIALQGHSTSGICSLSQAAAIAALKLPVSDFNPQLKEYKTRRNLALEVLRKSAKIKVVEPAGAFYLFADLSLILKENLNADGFAEKLLHEAQVAVVSGVDFGAPKCVRISFATDETTIRTACDVLVRYCDSL
jgi:aspartate aminotransferase